MIQSAIIKASYELIYKNLSDLGKETKLFMMCEKNEEVSDNSTKVIMGVSDVCQLCSDKNGEKIEENEIIFEAPTQVGAVLFFTVISNNYSSLLETVGLLIQYFKDNHFIQLDDYKWHGEKEGKIFIEPIVRKNETHNGNKNNDLPIITLEYTMELGINSLKGTTFKRVEKKIIKGGTIGAI